MKFTSLLLCMGQNVLLGSKIFLQKSPANPVFIRLKGTFVLLLRPQGVTRFSQPPKTCFRVRREVLIPHSSILRTIPVAFIYKFLLQMHRRGGVPSPPAKPDETSREGAETLPYAKSDETSREGTETLPYGFSAAVWF